MNLLKLGFGLGNLHANRYPPPIMDSHESVWAETTDGGLLRQLFGHYPTLHDATIVCIDIQREARRVSMTIDYADTAPEGEPEDPMRVRMQLQWQGVRSLRIPLEAVDILDLHFQMKGELLLTRLDTGIDAVAEILSDGFEALLMQVDPGDPEEVAWITMQ